MTKTTVEATTDIVKMKEGMMEVWVLGTRPMIQHPFNQKAKRELLMPSGRKTAGDKARTLKHNPLPEFQQSIYRTSDGNTAIGFPATGFKAGCGTAALEVPGVKKTTVNRCLRVLGDAQMGDLVSVYGIPQMYMSMVRASDINRTPDVRTRCIIPHWVACFKMRYVKPNFTANSVQALISNAGLMAGVGDDRVEKGHGAFGSYEVVSPTDPRVKRIIAEGSRDAQEEAMLNPEFYDEQTRELYTWIEEELTKRGPLAV